MCEKTKYIYLMSSFKENGEVFYKIGFSKKPEKRKNELQTGNESRIQVLKIYESKYYKEIEKWLHRKYFSKKTLEKHEWFTLSDEQVFSFTDDCKKAEEQISFLKQHNPFF